MTQFVYLSNAISGSISRYKFEREILTLIGETDVGHMVMPMTVSHCQQYLYAAIRSEPFKIVQMHIDQHNGELTIIQEKVVSESIVTLATDKQNKQLLAASFNQNRLRLDSLDSHGHLLPDEQVIQHQGHCHMFCFSPDEKWMLATEFGRDRLYIYAHKPLEHSEMQPVFHYDFPAGSGPRHMVFSPCGTFLYVLTEMSASIATFVFNQSDGSLTFVAESTVLPLKTLGLEQGLPPAQRVDHDVPRAWAADIHITNNGRFLYVSERTLSVVACLNIDQSNSVPSYSHHYPVELQPRSFCITADDKYLLISGELSDELGAYAIDSTSGALIRKSVAPCGKGAAWVCIADVSC